MDALWQVWQIVVVWVGMAWVWLLHLWTSIVMWPAWRSIFSWSALDTVIHYLSSIAAVVGAITTVIGFVMLFRRDNKMLPMRQAELLGKLKMLVSNLKSELMSGSLDKTDIEEERTVLKKCVKGEIYILEPRHQQEIDRLWKAANRRAMKIRDGEEKKLENDDKGEVTVLEEYLAKEHQQMLASLRK